MILASDEKFFGLAAEGAGECHDEQQGCQEQCKRQVCPRRFKKKTLDPVLNDP
jgi:hypothetical protein